MPSPRSAGHQSNAFSLGRVFATEPILLLMFALLAITCPAQTTAEALNVYDELERAKSRILEGPVKNLVEVPQIIREVHRARIKLRPAGYEMQDDYSAGFISLFNTFQRELTFGKVSSSSFEVDSTLLEELQRTVNENEVEYRDFVKKAQMTHNLLRNVSVSEILGAQLTFGIVLRSKSLALWERLKKFSYIFPLCFWQH